MYHAERESYTARRRAIAAIDAMHASRPLKPPPLPRNLTRASAGARELAREIRAGEYHGARVVLV
jgi:hypothetical protein